ncbi:nucleoside-triphosphatase THEP1 [Pseudomonas sp. PvR086]
MSEQEQEVGQENGQEQKQEYVFHPADLVEYAMDKPIGAARAALAIGLEDADVDPDLIIAELVGNMEFNQRFLKKLTSSLRKNPSKIVDDMPRRIRALQVERALGL